MSKVFEYREDELLPYPPDAVGMLTLVEKEMDWGHYGKFSTGFFWLQCSCGSPKFKMLRSNVARGLRTNASYIHSCGCTPLPRKPRERRDQPLEGRTIGRLVVGPMVLGVGHSCICTQCAETIHVMPDRLIQTAMLDCDDPCEDGGS